MKEGKKANTYNKTKKPSQTSSKPKITEVKATPVKKEDFFDEPEGGDKRLIVFIALAILIIVATIIGLIIGCEKKEKDGDKKPNNDVVIPVEEDHKDDNGGGVKTKEIVRKVYSAYKGKKTKEKSEEKEDVVVETETYNVAFYLDDDIEVKEVEEGSSVEAYVPKGYSACRYYSDSELEEEFDIEGEITEDINIYMDCDIIEYTIKYDTPTTNPTTYTVKDEETELVDPEVENFRGWYLDSTYETPVTKLTKDIVDYATTVDDVENVILIYALISETEVGVGGDQVPVTGSEEMSAESSMYDEDLTYINETESEEIESGEVEYIDEEPEYSDSEPENLDGVDEVVEDTIEGLEQEPEIIVPSDPITIVEEIEEEKEVIVEVPETIEPKEEVIATACNENKEKQIEVVEEEIEEEITEEISE